jgi:hypothetical protein
MEAVMDRTRSLEPETRADTSEASPETV